MSHGHGGLVSLLLADLAKHCGADIRVILTLNVPEALPLNDEPCPFPMDFIRNRSPRGFGSNHNAAFRNCRTPYFCVLNPDIQLRENPFPALIDELHRQAVGVAAPQVTDPAGNIEDSARRFPTAGIIMRKLLGLSDKQDYEATRHAFSPDWIAGMFMLFRSNVYSEVGGFDERYFLYYEDVDLCRRLRGRGYDVRVLPSVSVTHDARRSSHRNLRHLRWHVASMIRFLASG
ncbi:MAG TPA: glycosyltransferase [Burkholderiales bacterium]|nr:glycosyltransferase [Burkholderiales bacterium]